MKNLKQRNHKYKNLERGKGLNLAHALGESLGSHLTQITS